MSTAPGTTGDVVTKSIRLLATQGYHATTVDQLAQATGVSRATFFRKYGSKEDIVFADHASNLERLEQLLSRPNLTPQAGLAEGVQLVFRHNLDHADRAIARHHLLQQVESLRDRELATSHRYERLFQEFLRRVLPENADQRVTAVSMASATVAVHNAYLRTWLRDPRANSGEQLAAGLNQRIGWLCTVFGLSAGPGRIASVPRQPEQAASSSPVVVVLQEGADPRAAAEQAARSVYDALVAAQGQSNSRSETNTP
ncbi:TetR/AcrR family transcriptional regulator [Kocuria carniphila]|uniref:TetR/AcrR family transcriptional regulator n=1 Tax=Kocuria carniphila TaxID=262208 RepID=UPI00101C1637|nr:TetR/AcrR family transcriptional regulator [Kocuria carniphila]